MDRLRVSVAVTIVIVWAFVVILAAVKNPALTSLATVITPVMVGVVGWLYADSVLRGRQPRQRRQLQPREPREPEPRSNESPGEDGIDGDW